MAGNVKANAVQLGDSSTATQNFVWQTNVDGTAKLARGNVGATTQDVLTVDANGKVSLPATQGSVLQVQYYTDAGASATTNAFTNVSAANKTITPRSTNSTLIIECVTMGTVTAGGAGTNTTGEYILYDVEAVSTFGAAASLGVVSASGTNVQTQAPVPVIASRPNTALTARNFQLRARWATSSCTVTAGNQVWKITEVQN